MTQEEALKIARNWYNSRPYEQEATLKYLDELKASYSEQMGWLIGRIQAIETLVTCLKEQDGNVPEVFLKAFKE